MRVLHFLVRKRAKVFCGIAALGVAFVVWANFHVVTRNAPRLYEAATLNALPVRAVALVLGTSERLADGRANLHFTSRIDAAAQLFHAGKVRHLLVSGDNRRADYNEPLAMKNALIARGVPASAITCDYAGLRTLDSVVRARRIFALSDCIIVTQRYHNTRALEIARHEGLDALGYCAPDVVFRHSIQTEIREIAARTVTLLDLYLWHRDPRHLGPREPINVAKK